MKRIILLTVLAIEGIGGILGGLLLAVSPDGHLMDMPVEMMHGVFPDFLIPGIILTALGVINVAAFIAVFRKSYNDWIWASIALVGFAIWFTVEIIILRELHWLHVVWGTPIVIGIWAALPLIPERKHLKSAKMSI